MGNLLPLHENTNSWDLRIISNDEENVFGTLYINYFSIRQVYHHNMGQGIQEWIK